MDGQFVWTLFSLYLPHSELRFFKIATKMLGTQLTHTLNEELSIFKF